MKGYHNKAKFYRLQEKITTAQFLERYGFTKAFKQQCSYPQSREIIYASTLELFWG
jgi:hypothetical protein